jgi:hypothetical protein
MRIREERGQVLIEMILMIALFLGVAYFISSQFRDNNLLAQVVEAPWKYLAGMMENGVWKPADEGRELHPNVIGRHQTPTPEGL